MLGQFYDMFTELDATMIEVNPLAETPEGKGVQHGLHSPTAAPASRQPHPDTPLCIHARVQW